MNGWYLAAIFLGAATAFCTYYGSVVENKRNSEAQSAQIGSELQALGTQIQEFRLEAQSPEKSTKLQELDEQYQALAEQYFRSLDLKAAEEKARTAKQRVEEVQKTQELESYFNSIHSEAKKLAAAYNRSAGQTVLEIDSRPVSKNLSQLSSDGPAYILLKFSDRKYWAIRIVSYPDRTMALQYVRLLSPDDTEKYETMNLTNDSVNFVLSDRNFGVSLNQSISDAVKANVTDPLPKTRQPLSQFSDTTTDLTRRIIEYELLSLGQKKA